MIQKMKNNVLLTLVLLVIAIAYVWYTDGMEEVKIFLTEYWWVWILMPFALRFYAWFRNLKRKAFNVGAGIKEPEK